MGLLLFQFTLIVILSIKGLFAILLSPLEFLDTILTLRREYNYRLQEKRALNNLVTNEMSILGIFIRYVIRRGNKHLGYTEETFGKCVLSGTPDNILIFRSALTQLQKYDLQLGIDIIMAPWFIYSSGRRTFHNPKWMICGISDPWLKWSEQGVIVMIVYSRFLRICRLQGREIPNEQAHLELIKWLREHDFPEELFPPPEC